MAADHIVPDSPGLRYYQPIQSNKNSKLESQKPQSKSIEQEGGGRSRDIPYRVVLPHPAHGDDVPRPVRRGDDEEEEEVGGEEDGAGGGRGGARHFPATGRAAQVRRVGDLGGRRRGR